MSAQVRVSSPRTVRRNRRKRLKTVARCLAAVTIGENLKNCPVFVVGARVAFPKGNPPGPWLRLYGLILCPPRNAVNNYPLGREFENNAFGLLLATDRIPTCLLHPFALR